MVNVYSSRETGSPGFTLDGQFDIGRGYIAWTNFHLIFLLEKGLPSEKDFFHRRPPLVIAATFEGFLQRPRQIPPFFGAGIISVAGKIGSKIGAGIFPIGKQQVFRLSQKD